jgi:hypothetical protein
LFGVVSWGQPSCIGTASVFARVSVLRSIVLEGRAMLPSLAKSQYRARPELTKKPTITGWTGNAGATLTCHAGSWTNRPGSKAYRWYTQDSIPGTDPAAGQCLVIVHSATVSNNYNVAAALVNTRVRPVIESVSINDGGTSTRSVGSVWTCSAIAGGIYPATSLSQAARTFSWTSSDGTPLPRTKHLTWTADLITTIAKGTSITCTIHVLTARSNGVASTGTSAAVVAE